MLDTLKLVSGAVSTKDLMPVLTHFCIGGGRIQGANGRVAIDAACPELDGVDLIVPAERFLKAVDACQGEPLLKVNDEHTKLRISRGRFRATVPLLPSDTYPREGGPEGAKGEPLRSPLLPVLRLLRPFVSDDASRPWSCSILLREGYAYATNNVVLARVPIAWNGAELVISSAAADELLRIEKEPREILVQPHCFFALYENSWLRAQLLEGGWPQTLSRLIDMIRKEDLPPLPQGLLDDVALLTPFFPDPRIPVVLTGPEGVSTQDGLHSAAVDSDSGGLPKGAFRLESLSAVLAVATHMDISAYPNAVPWYGEGIEGLLSGIRL